MKEEVENRIELVRRIPRFVFNSWIFEEADRRFVNGLMSSAKDVTNFELYNCMENIPYFLENILHLSHQDFSFWSLELYYKQNLAEKTILPSKVSAYSNCNIFPFWTTGAESGGAEEGKLWKLRLWLEDWRDGRNVKATVEINGSNDQASSRMEDQVGKNALTWVSIFFGGSMV